MYFAKNMPKSSKSSCTLQRTLFIEAVDPAPGEPLVKSILQTIGGRVLSLILKVYKNYINL